MIVPKHIRELEAYKPGKSIFDASKEFGISNWVKLASNENPLGVSPAAKKAAIASVEEGHLYPHPRGPELITKLAQMYQKNEDQIVAANGIDAILTYVIIAFTSENDEVLTSQGTFIGAYVNTKKLNRKLTAVPLKNWGYDLDAILSLVTPQTKIIYLSNPNNPTGSWFSKSMLEKFFNAVPKHVLIILDEAYFEYAHHDFEYPDGLDYPLERLIVTRTMSKAYGMASFRVGYAISSSEIIAQIQKVKLPFEPSTISLKAAVAALDDHDFLRQTLSTNLEGLTYFAKEFERLNLSFVKNARGNFLMLVFENEKMAIKFNDECLKSGLILRPLGSFGIPRGVRISTGTTAQNCVAVQIIEKVILKQREGV